MRELLYKIFAEDVLIKGIAFAVAVVMVFVVRSELEASTALYVRVSYTEPHGRVMVSEQQVDQVKVFVRGPWGRINHAGETALDPIQINLSEHNDGELRFKPEMVRLPPGLRVESFVPSGMYLHYETEVRGTRPVQLTLEGAPAEGYRFRTATPTPKTVQLRGAQNALEAMRNVLTRPLNVANLTGPATLTVDLAPLPKHVWFVDPTAPRITANVVVELVEKRYANVPIRTTTSTQLVKIEPAVATVILRGENLNKLQELPQLMLDTTAEERKPPGTTYVKRLQVINLPQDIAAEVRPAQVEFTILKPEPPVKEKDPARKPTDKPATAP